MGNRSCQIVSINGSALNAEITQQELAIYENSRALGQALFDRTELMRLDFETRLRLGAPIEPGPLQLKEPSRYVYSRGSAFVPLKAIAAKA